MTDWKKRGNLLTKEFRFGFFNEAISFVDDIAIEAERVGHHPDMCVAYTAVTISLTTHDAGPVEKSGKITKKDLSLAKYIDVLYNKKYIIHRL